MLKVEPRGFESKFWRYASPILALLLTGVTSGLIFAGMGRPAGLTVYTFLVAPLLQQDGLQALVVKAAPLIMMGVGLSLAYRANVWNIGTDGQFTLGAICGGGLALAFPDTSAWLIFPAMMVVGTIGGMASGGLVAWLRIRFNANEILTSLMPVSYTHLDVYKRQVLRDFPLGPELGQCCGGHVSVMFEPLRPALAHVAVFGAGHVGHALVSLLAGLRLRVSLIDTRAETLDGAPAGIVARHTTDPAFEVDALPAGTIALVMTHDHQIDFNIIAAALRRTDFAAVGLIGSETKRVRFVRRLARLGVPADAVARLICPIGVPGSGGKLPAEIAIAVAAQILQIQQQMKVARPKPARTAMRLVHPATSDCGDCGGDCARLSVPQVASA